MSGWTEMIKQLQFINLSELTGGGAKKLNSLKSTQYLFSLSLSLLHAHSHTDMNASMLESFLHLSASLEGAIRQTEVGGFHGRPSFLASGLLLLTRTLKLQVQDLDRGLVSFLSMSNPTLVFVGHRTSLRSKVKELQLISRKAGTAL